VADMAEKRKCSRCLILKELTDFRKKGKEITERTKVCALCRHEKKKESDRQYVLNNRDKYNAYHRKWDASNPEKAVESDRKTRLRRVEKRRVESKRWARENPEKCRVIKRKRDAYKLNLPCNLTKVEFDITNTFFFGRCALTGENDTLHLEHFIALSTGHGGTTISNTYQMSGELNQSKCAKNPFTWYASRADIDPTRWSTLVAYLADANGLSPADFRTYVDWCYENPRTVDQIVTDNERYGYVVSSITLWNASKSSSTQIAG
jgi:hypothetical protein